MISLSPPRIYQGFIAAMVAFYLLWPDTRVIGFPANLLGLPLFAGGAYLAMAAKRQFQASQTPLSVTARSNQLHTGGWFRYSRNPMYLGIAIGLLGLAVVFSATVNFMFPPLFVILMDRFYVRGEERSLQEQFGPQYQDYCQRVRRWL